VLACLLRRKSLHAGRVWLRGTDSDYDSVMRANVLIVDDEESICWGLSRLLESEGHAASVASSAEEALARITESPPDLIVMDVRLPGMDGLSAMRQLRAQGDEVPIVVITAFGNLETAPFGLIK